MAARPLEVRLKELEEQKKHLVEKERRLKAQLSKEERKKRDRRLIITGGIVEKVLGRKLTDDDLPRFQKYLEDQEKRGGYFTKAMNSGTGN